MSSAQATESYRSEVETKTVRRVAKALIPFLMVCYLVSFIDRVNAGFAAFQMNKALGLTSSIFGFGGGLFFLTYFVFEVPSNLAMQRVGARRWLARIMLTWGIISSCTAFVAGPWSFCGVRLLLGAAEAGFFPGVLLYLTYWFPSEYRARIVSMFYVAVPISGFVGSPISATLLGMHGIGGLRGWQWLFILEGLPAVLLGLICLFALPDRPKDARFLSEEQRSWLSARLMEEQQQVRAVWDHRAWAVLSNPQVLLLALVYAGSSRQVMAYLSGNRRSSSHSGLTNMQAGLLQPQHRSPSPLRQCFCGRGILIAEASESGVPSCHSPSLSSLCLSVWCQRAFSRFWCYLALRSSGLSVSKLRFGLFPPKP